MIEINLLNKLLHTFKVYLMKIKIIVLKIEITFQSRVTLTKVDNILGYFEIGH